MIYINKNLIASFIICVLGMCAIGESADKPANSVDFKLINLSGKPIEVFWVDTISPEEKLVPQTKKPLRNNTDLLIHSYPNHKFSVRFLRHIPASEANFTKLAKDEVIKVTFNKETQQLQLTQATKFNEGITMLRDAVQECESTHHHASGSSKEALHKCIQGKTLSYAEEFTNARDTMSHYRDKLSESLRNYTCQDQQMNNTEPLRSYDYFFLNQLYSVQVLLDNDEAKIWTIENFVTEDECQYLMDYARPKLARATVAGEDGRSEISNHRKAQQASYDFNVEDIWSDPQWPLYDRIISMVNFHTHYHLQPEGQEGFTIIQYNPSDEYMPHCDGSCDGLPYRKFGRVATAVLYCQVPEIGGATTFTNADVFVKAQPGQAVFFSYKNNKNNRMDEKLTEHSGCPVIQGEKWIATAWLREGVSAEHPSDAFDPDGVPVMESEEEEGVEEYEAEVEVDVGLGGDSVA